jgi:hypothetical protein
LQVTPIASISGTSLHVLSKFEPLIMRFVSRLGERSAYSDFNGRTASDVFGPESINNSDVFTNPVIHPSDADRRAQSGICRTDEPNGFFLKVKFGNLFGIAGYDDTSPIFVINDLFNL